MHACGIQYDKFEKLAEQLRNDEPLRRELFADSRDSATDDSPSAETAAKKLPVSQQSLKRAWEASQRSTKEDWVEWIRRLSVELLKESPSHSLRSCASLASVYQPLARELFNAAFCFLLGRTIGIIPGRVCAGDQNSNHLSEHPSGNRPDVAQLGRVYGA
jgi:hypothetical protein